MKLLVSVAHPDDETFGCGSVIAAAIEDGHEVVVVCATRGEAGEPRPGSLAEGVDLASARGAELYEAAAVLGGARVRLLDFGDSGWDGPTPEQSLCGAPLEEVAAQLAAILRTELPDVIVTLDPGGGDGHRDHVRIAEATTIAFDRTQRDGALGPGARLYYWCLVRSVMQRWLSHNRGSVYDQASDDEVGCPDDQITTVVDVTALLPRRLAAIACHRSQVSPYDGLPADLVEAFLGTDRVIRARPPWTGRGIEASLFESA